ncbi:Patatin-like phospholipase domain-containing protein AN0408 [Hondaea fermentalgiana]|uniref:Patatin-like phospholipase domain-containing protein AN0408 n=1 Tax=Hondaea fermentalgiana TaxID=2315210 RepID=A0A2R5GBT6_9STRA|nr:Patatin-like phospholipase domain-containing protein AN0408 [Hondaea fermentalgiana]|eukprot:GBG25581.1 Patatin-like phospholipase domain-containing protein AN0408 [Hondaea fermentalgiana]
MHERQAKPNPQAPRAGRLQTPRGERSARERTANAQDPGGGRKRPASTGPSPPKPGLGRDQARPQQTGPGPSAGPGRRAARPLARSLSLAAIEPGRRLEGPETLATRACNEREADAFRYLGEGGHGRKDAGRMPNAADQDFAQALGPLMLPVRVAMAIVRAMASMAKLHAKTTLMLCGLSPADFMLPARNPGRHFALDLVWRILRFVLRMLRMAFYPEILFRNVAAAIAFQTFYQAGGYTYKRLRARILMFTERGRNMAHFRAKMDAAKSYPEYREAEKAYLNVLGSAEVPLDPSQRKIVAQLTGKVERYRAFIVNNDVRRLTFELRSDLLRKHFGHDQFHPLVRQAMQRYVSVVCCAFGLIATGQVPDELEELLCMDQEVLSAPTTKTDAHGGVDPVRTPEVDKATPGSELNPGADTPSKINGRGPMSIEEKLSKARLRLDFFAETRHSFGRSALLLSGGARMGLYHVGVVKTLLEHRLLPRVISGSSAGSIIAAVLACKNDEEIVAELFNPEKMNLRFFGRSDSIDTGLQAILQGTEPPEYIKKSLLAAFTGETNGGNSLLGTLLMLLPPPFPSYIMILRKLLPRWIDSKTLLDIDVLKTAIRNIVGDMTFQEAFDRTGRIVNITVTPHGGDREVPNLLNYLTAPYVTLWSASCASCCIPGVFAPVTLMVKTLEGTLEPYNPAGLTWIDGSLEADLPMERLSELFNMNHSICSQVNPHGAILAPHEHSDLEELSSLDRRFFAAIGRLTQFARDQGRSYLKHAASFGMKSTIFGPLKGLIPVLTQKYSGDVTIYPRVRASDFFTLLRNPSEAEYAACIQEGERITWPKLQSIRRRCMVEFMLDDCVHAMQSQIARLERRLQQRRCGGRANGRSGGFQRSLALDAPGPHGTAQDVDMEQLTTDVGSARGGPSIHDAAGIPMSRVASYSVFRARSMDDDSTEGELDDDDLDSGSPKSPMFGSFPAASHADPYERRDRVTSDEEDEDSWQAQQSGRMPRSDTSHRLESKLLGRISSVHQFNTFANRYGVDLEDEDNEEEEEHFGAAGDLGFNHGGDVAESGGAKGAPDSTLFGDVSGNIEEGDEGEEEDEEDDDQA